MDPKKHLEYYSRIYPSAWKQVDQFREGRGKELPFWPEWCFLPLAGAYAIVTAEATSQGIDITSEKGMYIFNDVGIIGTLAAWRPTQGVYRFDPDVYAAVVDTPITGDLPHNILFNLPEWCVYIETPGLEILGRPLYGFFAHLEQDANDGRKELRLVLDHTGPQDERPILMPQPIHLGPWPLLESIERVVREARAQADRLFNSDVDIPDEMPNVLEKSYMPMVSLLLYICSTNGEIGDGEHRPKRPRSTKTKKGQRMFPPHKVTTWDVGTRMGSALRKARQTVESPGTVDMTAGPHSSPRAHVRRAHWHGYWIGPRDGEQKFILKWISPVLVGAAGEDLPVTIRPVK